MMELAKIPVRQVRAGDAVHFGCTVVHNIVRVETATHRTTLHLSDGDQLPFMPFTVVRIEVER